MINELNAKAWERVKRYLNLRVGKWRIAAPYFTNDVGRYFGQMMREAGLTPGEIKAVFAKYNDNQVPWGWFRGKGTPEQLEMATAQIAGSAGVDWETATEEGAREFMRLHGLGVDCSGFAYNVLANSLGEEKLWGCLNWEGQEKSVYKAGAKAFADRGTKVVQQGELGPLDLIYLENPDSHVVVILEKDGRLWTAQSTATAMPPGVRVDEMKMENGKPEFGFGPSRGKRWEELYEAGKLEFRRLCIFT